MPPSATDTDLRDDALELQDALTDLVRAYQFRDRDAVCCYDVSLAQSHALERITRRGPMSLNEFAAALFLEKSSASRLAEGLVRKGYLRRDPDPRDGRFVRLDLTPEGRELADRLLDDLLVERADMLAGFSARERKSVLKALSGLARSAAEAIDTDGGCSIRR
jgi:DNA-binding MarR family transcriptional regulator